MLQLVETKEVTDSNNNKLNYSIWQHDSGRFIQLLQQKFYNMNEDKDYLKTISCNEVVKKYDNQFKEYYFIQKEKGIMKTTKRSRIYQNMGLNHR